jgi:hypothetical protein
MVRASGAADQTGAALIRPALFAQNGAVERDLRDLRIEVRLDCPGVGAQLWDHAAVPVYLRPKPGQCVPGRDPRFQVLATFSAEGSPERDDMQLVMSTHQDVSGIPALHAAADRLRSYIIENIGTYCHASGTVRMGPEANGGAVVDQCCRVRGIANLWVVDASVMPAIPRAAPNLTVIMLAERASEWLREAPKRDV